MHEIKIAEIEVRIPSDTGIPKAKKSRTTKDIYERLVHGGQFEDWWTMYRRACRELECSAGGKREAAEQWHKLEQKGIDLDAVVTATTWDISNRIDLKKRGKFARFLPHACNYLRAGYWETALENMADEVN